MRFSWFLVFFTCFLVISITPCCAVLISGGSGNTPYNIIKNKVNNNDSLSLIDEDLVGLDSVVSSLNQSVTYIKKRYDDFGWNIFKWPGIIDDISKTAKKIHSDTNKCKKIISKIKKHVSNLNLGKTNSKLLSDDSSYINNVDNSFCQDDAQYMASELTKALNANFTVQNVSASELREGDIIQYLSEGKYPRYLKVQKIESSTSTSRKLLGTTPLDVSMGYLECTGDKIVEVPLVGDVICLARPDGVNVYDTLTTSVEIQENSIDTSRSEGEKLEKRSGRIDTSIDVLIGLDKFMATVMVFGMIEATVTGLITPPSWVGEFITIVFAVLAFTISFILLELNSAYNKLNKEANTLITDATSCEADLNTYTVTEPKDEIIMNITTFNGIPIIKQPPINGWKDYLFVRIVDPQYGDLLPGPGLQFLYGPNEGFTGKDWFKFQYIDSYGRVKGNITVNILVSPIPVFNIPSLNRTYGVVGL